MPQWRQRYLRAGQDRCKCRTDNRSRSYRTPTAAGTNSTQRNRTGTERETMKLEDCWIAYFTYYATGEGMHYVVALAPSAERAQQLFERQANELARGNSTTAPLGEAFEKHPALRDLIPEEVRRRTSDGLCWTLEYFGTIDFNCA
jgi:hypothetical protein